MNNDISLLELQKAFELLDSPKKVEPEYRLYYNEEGLIYKTTNLKSDPTDNAAFVVVTEDIYRRYTRYRIENGKPELIPNMEGYVTPGIIRSKDGFKVVKNHANLPLNIGEEYPETEYYDYRSNRHS
jgi:hypothetical protein